MNKISDQIMEGMKTAMKAKDTVTLNTLRALKTALTNTAIAKGGLGTLLEEAEELAVVRKQIKQREDSAEQFRSAGRPELAEKEEAEIAVLKQFMPAELTAEETAAILETVMKETGASTKKDMGQVMKLMQERTAGRVNGKELATSQGKDHVFTFRVPLEGEVKVEAVAGKCRDKAVFTHVDTPNPDYKLKKSKNQQASNWVDA